MEYLERGMFIPFCVNLLQRVNFAGKNVLSYLGRMGGGEMRELLKKKPDRSILFHYLLTYIIVLIIPLFISSSYYINMISRIGEDDIRSSKNELEHGAVLVDTLFNEVTHLGESLADNCMINTFMNVENTWEYPNVYNILRLQDSLPALYQINQSIFNYYVFLEKNDTVINKEMVYSYRNFYDLCFRPQDVNSYEEWYALMKDEKPVYGFSAMEEYLNRESETKNMLVYSRPLLLNTASENMNSKVLIMLEDTALETLMPVMPEIGMQYIVDFKGDIIYCKVKGDMFTQEEVLEAVDDRVLSDDEDVTIQIKNEKYLILQYESLKSGLSYYSLQPISVINQRKISSITAMTICILAATLVGMMLSYYMSLRNVTPIKDILTEVLKTTERISGHRQVFTSLKTTFQELRSTNSDLAKAIEEQRPYVSNALFYRLIYGDVITEEEIKRSLSLMGKNFDNRIYCVVIFQFHQGKWMSGEEEVGLVSSCMLFLMEVLMHLMPDCLCINSGEGQVVLLLNYPKEDKKDFRRMAEGQIAAIENELPRTIKDKMFVYGGNLVCKLSDVRESYNNASYMFYNEKEQRENIVIWYKSNNNIIPPYPSQDFGMKLIHYVTAGDVDGLHNELESLVETYIINNNLPVYLQHMLLYELQIVLFRVLGATGLDEAEYRKYYDSLEANHNLPLIIQITNTLNMYKEICREINDRKNNLDSGRLMPSIVTYIDTNYGDCNLSLGVVADIFQIREPYLSAIFRQTMGIKFSSYVESVRIEKAKEFLKATDISISEISEMVGYFSTNSFCRAFKRVTGISATEYRRK